MRAGGGERVAGGVVVEGPLGGDALGGEIGSLALAEQAVGCEVARFLGE